MPEIMIYRGSNEIGGTCIEIKANNGKKLWVDLGAPLNDKNANIDYAINQNPDALLISHPHQDHYGLMEYLDKETPVYMGEISKGLIEVPRIFLNRPFLNNNIKTLKAWKPESIADTFNVTPYLVDHSSPEAFSFLIEVDNKRIFYSGDFRATGRKHVLYDNFIKKPPKDIDLLFLEGTMLERDDQIYKTEDDVEKSLLEIIRNQKNISFVISSAQNIDRFVSLVKCCLNTSNKKVVVDVYNAMVLDIVKQKSPNLPTIEWPEVLVYKKDSQLQKIDTDEYKDFYNRINKQSVDNNDVFNNPSSYIYFLRYPNMRFLNKFRRKEKINLIYSQWTGYLKKEHEQHFTDVINNLKQDKDINYYEIHTSGHASLEELKNFARALAPKQIVPIHTENPELFKQEFEKAGFNNVKTYNDFEQVEDPNQGKSLIKI
jgi:ribonuclease J